MLTYAYFGLLRLTWAIGRSVGDSTGRIFAALVLGRARVGRMAVAAPGARTVDEVSLEVVAKRAAARDRKRLQRHLFVLNWICIVMTCACEERCCASEERACRVYVVFCALTQRTFTSPGPWPFFGTLGVNERGREHSHVEAEVR